jgi:hypothetical protein
MSPNAKTALDTQRVDAPPRQPGHSVFKTMLSEDVGWNPLAGYPSSARLVVDERIPLAVTWPRTQQIIPQVKTFNAASVAHMPARVGQLNLTGSQLLVGFICLLSAIRIVMWAVLKLWLFEP